MAMLMCCVLYQMDVSFCCFTAMFRIIGSGLGMLGLWLGCPYQNGQGERVWVPVPYTWKRAIAIL